MPRPTRTGRDEFTRRARWTAGVVFTLGAACALWGDVILFDERVDKEEITEIRYQVPDDRVITGLGFRAHYDNITTMHCRHHRLTRDGRLVEPQEVHLGAEADHPCEGKVLLPDGWVAVGFGAAGEPEWDVTLVRVWARKLNADGTLGEVKAFSDGFKPDRGPERQVLLEQTNRVLTGAGLRFGANDILGVFGCSKQLMVLDPQAAERLRRPTRCGWIIERLDSALPAALSREMQAYRVKRLDVPLASVPASGQSRALKALRSAAEDTGIETYVWITVDDGDILRGPLETHFDRIGLVLDLRTSSQFPRAFLEEIRKRTRRVWLRLGILDPALCESIRDLARDVGVMIPVSALGTAGNLAGLGERPVLVEVDWANHATVRAGLPDVPINELASHLARGKLAGADGFVIHAGTARPGLTDALLSLGRAAFHRLSADPLQPTDRLWQTLCESQFGKVAPLAEASLRHASAASTLIFGGLGVRFLWGEGGILPADRARAQLQQWLADSVEGKDLQSIQLLLTPTEGVMRELSLERETASWFIRQSLSAAEKAVAEDATPQTRQLLAAVERAQQAIAFCREVTRCFALAQLYAQDAAPVTREAIEAAVRSLPAMAEKTAAIIGDRTLCQGLDAFIDSIQASMKESFGNAPIAGALRHARELAGNRRYEEATQQLYDILHSEELAPHVNKHKIAFGEVTSSLETLWQVPDHLRSLRGGDGQWTLARKAGRWCWAATEKYPCIYFDVLIGPLEKPADCLLSFEYFDEGDFRLYIHYDSDYPGGLAEREFHPAEPVQLTNTKTWKTTSRTLTRCRFANGQNENADMRLLGGRGRLIYIRNLRLDKN